MLAFTAATGNALTAGLAGFAFTICFLPRIILFLAFATPKIQTVVCIFGDIQA